MTKPWEIVSTFQDQLRSKARMFASSEDLGQVQKFIAPNGSNALTLKLQKVKSVLDESVRIIEESKPPRLNLSCLSICQNHKSLDQSDITGNYKNSVDPVILSSIFQSFEKYLEVQRQNFKSMVQQMFDLTEASCDVAYKQVCSDLIPQSSCNFQVTSTTCGTSGEAELIPRALTNDVQKSQITVGSSSTCGVTSATPSSDASCSSHINTLAGFKSKGEDLANLHNALQKSSADAISKEDEFSGVGPFDQGLVCGNFRPIRKSASKKLEGFSKCIVNTSDSSSELLVKEDVNMSTALKSTFKNQITLCSTEKENFLEDLSIMASEKSSISNHKAVVTARTSKVKTRDNTEVQQTRSGRAVKSPKQYWLCQRPEESLHEKAGFTISARSKTACAGIETLKSVAVKTAVSRKKPQAHTVSTTNSDKESRKPLETSKIIFNKEEQNTNVMEMKTKNGLPEYCDSNSGPEATKGLKSRKRKVQESKQKIVVSKPAKAVAVPKLNPAKKPRKTCKTSEQILSSEDDYLNTTGGASGEWRVVLCNLSSSEKNVNQLGGRYVTLKKHDNDKVSKMLEGKTTVRKRVLKQATCREVKNYVANENIEADPYQKERSVRAVSKGNKRSNSRRQLHCDTVKKKKLMPIEKRTGAIKNLKASSNKTVAPVACKERTKELPTYDSNSDGTFEPAFECYFQD